MMISCIIFTGTRARMEKQLLLWKMKERKEKKPRKEMTTMTKFLLNDAYNISHFRESLLSLLLCAVYSSKILLQPDAKEMNEWQTKQTKKALQIRCILLVLILDRVCSLTVSQTSLEIAQCLNMKTFDVCSDFFSVLYSSSVFSGRNEQKKREKKKLHRCQPKKFNFFSNIFLQKHFSASKITLI